MMNFLSVRNCNVLGCLYKTLPRRAHEGNVVSTGTTKNADIVTYLKLFSCKMLSDFLTPAKAIGVSLAM